MTETGDEHNLVMAVAKGDLGAVDTLLDRHLPGLRAFIRLRMGPTIRNRESCSDLAQSVCREVLQHMDRFQYPGENAFKHWLYATALRKISNRHEYYTAAKRDAGLEVRVDNADASASGADEVRLADAYKSLHSPSKEVLAKEYISQIESAFDELPEDYREVVILSRFVGLSRAEIAQQMNRTEDSVRNLLHRALSRLAEVLERYENGRPD
jgi:RNA polymerase sigma-70 factor (subfamily 1)